MENDIRVLSEGWWCKQTSDADRQSQRPPQYSGCVKSIQILLCDYMRFHSHPALPSHHLGKVSQQQGSFAYFSSFQLRFQRS